MRRVSLSRSGLLVAMAVIGLTICPCLAQDVVKPKVDPSVCKQIQAQIDDLVAVSRSQSLSQDEKAAALSKAWAQSLATIRDTAHKGDEKVKMAKELSDSVAKVLALALTAPASPQQGKSPQTNQAVTDLTEQIKPYMSFMKILCPDLILPTFMPK